MGCVVAKQAVSVTPAIEHSVESEKNRKKKTESVGASRSELGESGRASSNGGSESLSFRLGNLSKYVEGEQAAAGWPAWLSAVACEAIHGWVPLRADAFEKLDKARKNLDCHISASVTSNVLPSVWLVWKKIGGRACRAESRKPSRNPLALSKLAPAEDLSSQTQTSQKMDDRSVHIIKEENTNTCEEAPKQSSGKPEDASSYMKNASQVDIPFPGPLQVSKSSGFAWAKRRRDDTSVRSHSRSISRGYIFNSSETSTLNSRNNSESRNHENKKFFGAHANSRGHDLLEISKLAMQNQWSKFDRLDSFDTCDEYHSQELSVALYNRQDSLSKRSNLSYQDQAEKVEFSGPLLSQMHTVDELLERHESHIRRTVRRSWFQRGKKQGK
ncbi:hypothetical protein JHK85_011916 [Glycine max]|nr:hypothetical protein JHK85_011916 [Glycine max]